MAKLPNTPDLDRLRAREPVLFSIPRGSVVHRVYRRGGAYPTLWNAFRFFGLTSARFDHQLPDEGGGPSEQQRGVLYAATDIVTALAEAFQQGRTVNRLANRPWLVSFALASELTLLDLTGTFPISVGASMKLASGPTLYSQNWSRGFYECYPGVHGLYYFGSLTNRPVMALYERALYERALDAGVFPATPSVHRSLHDPLLIEPLRNACRTIGYDLL